MPRIPTSGSGSFARPEVKQDDTVRRLWSAGWVRIAAAAILVVLLGGMAITARRYFRSQH